MIETRVLKQFLVVAEELNFHRAALRLHMSQPPLSVAIRQLEEKLGLTLFIRDRGGVQLTPAGESFVQTASAMLQALNDGISQARNIAGGKAGKLTISSVSLAAYPTLLNALRLFRQRYQQVELVIKEMPSARQIQALQRGETDLSFVRKPALMPQDVVSALFSSERIMVALPARHRLAAEKTLNLAQLAQEDFVFTPERLGDGYYHQLLGLCIQAGFYPKIVQEAAQLSTLIALVSCGFGVALVPESVTVHTFSDSVRFLPLQTEGHSPCVELFMLQRAGPVPALLANFLTLLDSERVLTKNKDISL